MYKGFRVPLLGAFSVPPQTSLLLFNIIDAGYICSCVTQIKAKKNEKEMDACDGYLWTMSQNM